MRFESDCVSGTARSAQAVSPEGRGQTARVAVGLAAAIAVGVSVMGFSPSHAGEAPLVALSDIDPSIRQDMRYAGANNFTGARVPGYEAAACWLRPAVAQALKRVQATLAAEHPGLSLKVFDCYRPRRSVSAFMAWAGARGNAEPDYHPNVARNALVPRGYIGRASTHSKGIAVDLTVVRTGSDVAAAQHAEQKGNGASAGAPCTETSDKATDPASLDMGTSFDCFDPKSHTHAQGVTAEQRKARLLLARVMERHGFANYPKEWWHFTFAAADDGQSFDVPVRAPGKR
ncbi:MAG: M15 family metallopeptidase [Hyphomicrobiaceae bacterium]|nr:M15 family metallopeptidase [Hyphomicrobiaceae bacterium]MCC0007778.1 M15 family metallopeptidase [Hyphomicrobiaceae bacterium]